MNMPMRWTGTFSPPLALSKRKNIHNNPSLLPVSRVNRVGFIQICFVQKIHVPQGVGWKAGQNAPLFRAKPLQAVPSGCFCDMREAVQKVSSVRNVPLLRDSFRTGLSGLRESRWEKLIH
jgi:hypothetical protein